MKWLSYVCLALVVAFVSSCSDEDPITDKVDNGLAAHMSLTVKVPVVEPVEMTRGINDYESEMNELVVVMFSKTSPRKAIINLTGHLVSGTFDENGHRFYTLAEDVVTESGEYTVYAIANFTSPYCGLTLDYLESENLTEENLKQELAQNATKTHLLTGKDRMPMTQVIDNLIIYSDKDVEADNSKKNVLPLSLKRVMAHIEFEFQGNKEKGITFNPYEYTVYNLPKGAYLLDRGKEGNQTDVEYFNTDTYNTDGSSFDFFMLENVQMKLNDYGNSVTDGFKGYNDRDRWDPEKSTEGNKYFIFAPENSTYVVVRGTYYGPGQTSGSHYTGECTYTIHLGGNNDKSDFSVNRNEYHKYLIKINGVNTILNEALAEVEINVYGGTEASGAEGFLRQVTNSFILDAHYERVRIEIGKTYYDNYLKKLKPNSTDLDHIDHTILLCTPETSLTNQNVKITYDGTAYKVDESSKYNDIFWIHFIKPDDINKVPPYDEEKAGSILDFLAAPDDYCALEGTTYYTYAYVDEYFYDDRHPKDFVNVMNRSFVLDPIDIRYSQDNKSVAIETTLFDISQRSIKSSWDMGKIGAGDFPYGIETWDETGAMAWNLSTPSTVTSDQGLKNTIALLDENKDKVSMSNNTWAYIGYRHSVNDNTKSRHRWYDDEHFKNYLDGKYTDEDINEDINMYITDPLTAVLARNRIKTENGVIDRSSIKWYLPGISQYLIVWLGQNMLQEDTRLMDVSKLTTITADNMDRSQHYLTSSADKRRLYWQDQGACWSEIAKWNAIGDDNGPRLNKIRCMRNLRNQYLDDLYSSKDGLTKDSPVKFPITRSGRTFSLGSIANSRTIYMTGGYDVHTERQPENYLYEKFEVAKPSEGHFDGGTAPDDDFYCCLFPKPTSWENMSQIVKDMNAKAAAYYQDTDNKTDLGQWRVPNQRELMIIAVMDNDASDPILPKGVSTRRNILTTTWFTGYKNTARTVPFIFDSGTSGDSDYNMSLPGGLAHDNAGALLFVRDVKE